MSDLPVNWGVARLVDLLTPLEDGRYLHQGWSPKCEQFPSQRSDIWGVLKTTAIQDGRFLPEHNKQLPSNLEPRPNLEIKTGDLLLTCAGPRIRCGVPCLVKETRPKLMMSGKMYRMRVSDSDADARYIEAALRSNDAQAQIDSMKTGMSESGMNLTHARFAELTIPVAPVKEQKRIADKLDVLLSRVDLCRERLDRVPAILKRFRQSVLAAATSGKLTEDWREERLSLINCYKEKTLSDLLAEPLRNGKSVRDGNGPPVLRLTAVKGNQIDWDETKPGDWTGLEFTRFIAADGDYMVVRGNGSRHLVGRGCIAENPPRDTAFPDTLIRVRVDPEKILPRYLSLVWDTVEVREQIEKASQTTTGLWKISQPSLESIVLPVPEVQEQIEIVRRSSDLLAITDTLEARYNSARQQVDSLTPSLLAKAFRGELVPQDPSDESASVLLERIRTARETAKPAKKRKTKVR